MDSFGGDWGSDWGSELSLFDPGQVDVLALDDFSLGEFDSPYASFGSYVPESLPVLDVQSSSFDWSQLGDTFARVGSILTPIVRAGTDIAAMVQGQPTSAQRTAAQQQAAMQNAPILQRLGIASTAQQASQLNVLLLALGGGIIVLVVMRKKGRR